MKRKKSSQRTKMTRRLKSALKRATGRTWSVTSTEYEIMVRAPKNRQVSHRYLPYTYRDTGTAPTFLEVDLDRPSGHGAYTTQDDCLVLTDVFAVDFVPPAGLCIPRTQWKFYAERAEHAALKNEQR